MRVPDIEFCCDDSYKHLQTLKHFSIHALYDNAHIISEGSIYQT